MKTEFKAKVTAAILGAALAVMLVPAVALAETADLPDTDIAAGDVAPIDDTATTTDKTPATVVDSLVGPANPAPPADSQNDEGDCAPDSVPAPTTTKTPTTAAVEEDAPSTTPVTSDDADDGDSGADGDATLPERTEEPVSREESTNAPASVPEAPKKAVAAGNAVDDVITTQEVEQDSTTMEDEGTTSEGIYWKFQANAGGGAMLRLYTSYDYLEYRSIKDYGSADEAPWYKYRDRITYIELCRILRIGNHAFDGYSNVTEIMLEGDSFTEIGAYAFYGMSIRSVFIPDSVTSIEDHAFDGGYTNTEFEIGKLKSNLVKLGTRALGGPEYITVTYAGMNTDWNKIQGSNAYESATLNFDEPAHTVTFDPNGGSIASGGYTATTNKNGQLTSLPTPVKSDYTFNGWFYDDGTQLVANSGKITNDVTVTARWTPNQVTPPSTTYLVLFDPNGGTLTSADSIVTDTSGVLIYQPEDPTREGYTFAGWFDDPDAGTQVSTTDPFATNTRLYAHWTPVQVTPPSTSYAIVFDPNGGELAGNTTITTDENGKLTSMPEDPTREGYTFAGWFDDPDGGEAVDMSGVFEASGIVYAHWTAKMPDDPSNPDDPSDPSDPDDPSDPSDPGKPGEPTKPSYTVIGGADSKWNAADGTDLEVRADGEFAKFDHIKVDGVKVDAMHYDVREGSTIVTLKRAFLSTLGEGSHNLTFVYKDGGEASTSFAVAAKPAVYVPGDDETTTTQVADKGMTSGVSGSDNPKTADDGKALSLYLFALLAGIAGLCGARVARRVRQ